VVFDEELAAALPAGAVVTDPDVLESYRHDRTVWVEPGQPAAAVLPTTTEQVATAVRIAADHGVPVLPRGAGTSYAGGATASDGCLVVSLERMDRILGIDVTDQLAHVEPGVFNADISDAGAEHGLFYPPDPASRTFSTIGGNIATNAGGLCCVKYGVTRDHVQRLEVVLADGRVIETGRDTIKGVAGLDLTSLLVGSEGQLGIVTRATLRLRPAPDGAATLVAFFPTLGAAGAAVAAVARDGLGLSLVEVMDHGSIVAVDDWLNMGLDRDAAALLLMQSDAPEPVRTREIERAVELCDTNGATYTAGTSDPDEGEALLEARRSVGSALDRFPGTAIHEDVCVPRSKVPELIGRIEEITARHDVRSATIGHAGDGNLHPTLIVEEGDVGLRRGLEAFEAVVAATLDLGGTISGEHGLGSIKGRYLEREVGAANLGVQRAVKRAFDPGGVFVPNQWLRG
jgi:glycolate oxidase